MNENKILIKWNGRGYEYDIMQFAFEYDNSSIYNLLFKYTPVNIERSL